MRYFKQETTGFDTGDCVRACVISLLDPLNTFDIPNFALREDWFETLIRVCREDGRFYPFGIAEDASGAFKDGAPEGYAIALGQTPSGSDHAVVMFSGRTIHDPHPTEPGLAMIKGFIIFVPWLWL